MAIIALRGAKLMTETYLKSKDELMKEMGTSPQGFSSDQAAKILQEKGPNQLQEGKKKSTIEVFFSQFKDLLVIILIAAAVISMISGNTESTIVIFVVIILNAILGTVQHKKAEKSLEALRSLSAPHARVIRSGEEKLIAVYAYCNLHGLWKA